MTFNSSGAPIWPPLVTTGTAPFPMRISLILSSSSLVSGTLVDNKNATSGRVLRSFCTLDVASDIGGVNTSSTVSLSFSLSKPPSRMALVKLTGDAVLSITMPTDCGGLPLACVANFTKIGNAAAACVLALGDVWKTYLKPRSLIWSE